MPPAIQIDQINKSFLSGRTTNYALNNLSLIIQKGEVFGFLGPNGAGKSTTIKLLLHFLRPDSGTMQIMGNTIGRDEFRHQIGYLSEFPCFYDHLSATETLMLAGRLSGMSKNTLHIRIPELLARMGLSDAANRRVGGFSKGMKQRLGMANALIHNPQILIFDEPMSGLDPIGRHLIKDIILELKKLGKTIFFSSHILSDIQALCDRIGIIHKGKLLYDGKLADFIQNDHLEDRFVAMIEENDRAAISH
ncbi:MAG: ABC transporter ATP-binding protein [Proteobacteria bacterium]|nr:ABC transporter ATP-binding protein [Pseudomonadota bacterium]MBU1716408.1 ABC transporter ATP-binding protein [Pseudomonadota bacterium]